MQQLKPNLGLPSLIAMVLLAYCSAIILPAFNADDVIQTQAISGDYNTFLSQGRWGYYIIYAIISGANPLGPAGFVFGLVILSSAMYLASKLLNFKSQFAELAFVLIASISLYYSSVFSFDSTRLAYPLAVLLAILGVQLTIRNRFLLAIICFAVSPSMYPSSTQVALTLGCAFAMFAAKRSTSEPITFLFKLAIFIALGLIIYVLSTHFVAHLKGIPLSGRSAVDPIGALKNFDRITKLFLGHSLPSGYQLPYFNKALIVITSGLMLLFALAVAVSLPVTRIPLALLIFAGLICSPYALAFATPLDEFSPRALIAFSIVHATFAAFAIETFEFKKVKIAAYTTAIAALSYLGITSVQINASAFDEYLSSRNDVLYTSRIIQKIDDVISGSSIPMSGPIPIAVRFKTPYSSSPSGEPATARSAPWSKEWIFRQVDPRFSPVGPEVAEDLLSDAPDVAYPDSRSVYIKDGAVVVVIN